MGIVFHTRYNGKDMKSLSSESFGTVSGSSKRNVFLASGNTKDTSGSSTFNPGELVNLMHN